MNNYFYILIKKQVIATDDIHLWANWMNSFRSRIIKQDKICPYFFSTVFLGIDHRFHGEGPPILFETMVFENGESIKMIRYESYEEAVKGHIEIMEKYSNES